MNELPNHRNGRAPLVSSIRSFEHSIVIRHSNFVIRLRRNFVIRLQARIFRLVLHYFKFRQDLLDPQPAKDVYIKRKSGKGWPEQCPPIRAANGFGWDLLANFSIEFVRTRCGWSVKPDVVIESDFDWSSSDEAATQPRL